MKYRLLIPIWVLCGSLISMAQEVGTPQARNGHPRLLFDAADLPVIRERARHPALAGLTERVKEMTARDGGQFSEISSIHYDMRPRDLATLYLITGDREYAERCGAIVDDMLADGEYWRDPRSKGLTRAAGALTVALAYDLCRDAWPEARNRRVSAELMKVAGELNRSMGAGANTHIANNWQGVRYSTVLVAALATDEPGGHELAASAFQNLSRHLRENLGGAAWNPEGVGYLTYPWTFTGPAGIVARRAGLGDIRDAVPPTRETLWTQYAGTVPIPTVENDHGLYPDLSDDNPRLGSRGTAGLAFHYLPDAALGAARYAYDMMFPGDHFDVSWGGGLYTLLYYPIDTPPEDPEKAGRLNYRDDTQGLAIFRNRWEDENDIVVLANATERRARGGHSGPDVNTFRVLGLGGCFVTGAGRTGDPAGQTNLFADPEPPRRGDGSLGSLVSADFTEDGGGTARIRGSCLGVEDHGRMLRVDYTGKTGFPAVILNSETSLNGRLWRLNTPEFNRVEVDGNRFALHSPNGAVMRGVVLEPAEVEIRTGRVERGGSNVGFPYRGKVYTHNTWLEFDVEGRAAVVFTLDRDGAALGELRRYLHGVEVDLGGWVAQYDRGRATLELYEAGKQPELASRKQPLPVRRLHAETRGDRHIRLEWIAGERGAERVALERAVNGADDWQVAREFPPDVESHLEDDLKTDTRYRYRMVAVNEHGRAEPSEVAEATTWPAGMEERVEDFAPADAVAAHRLGDWRAVDSPGPGLRWESGEGSPTAAGTDAGYWAVGYVPIGQSRALVLDDGIRVDLSTPGSKVFFDMMAQATTVFSPMFKPRDGRWVMAGRAYDSSRHEWNTLEFDPHDPEMKWWRVHPGELRRDSDELEDFDAARELKDVRGLGIYMEWVINRKFANLDQFRVRGIFGEE